LNGFSVFGLSVFGEERSAVSKKERSAVSYQPLAKTKTKARLRRRVKQFDR
jgi:hypothetical protein